MDPFTRGLARYTNMLIYTMKMECFHFKMSNGLLESSRLNQTPITGRSILAGSEDSMDEDHQNI